MVTMNGFASSAEARVAGFVSARIIPVTHNQPTTTNARVADINELQYFYAE
jgi:hypothetical protein